MRVLNVLQDLWPHLLAVLTLVVNVLVSGHVVLNKRNVRSAISWVGLVWLAPAVGAALYVLVGVNRIRRRARELRLEHGQFSQEQQGLQSPAGGLGGDTEHLSVLARLGDRVTHRSLLIGNRIEVLDGADAAFAAMLAAIDGAQGSITLCTYIFDSDEAGLRFADALARAQGRGVQVRVLIDGVGVRYSRRPMHRRLARAGVRVALFLPSIAPARLPFLNLRNHRKVMVVDGKLGFTGGMNIRHDVRDVHFSLRGPVVRHLQESFAEDWAFTTRERLEGERWFPLLEPEGEVLARGVADGPDEDFDVLRWTLLGALGVARRSVRIVTPYFLPDAALITALNVAALRQVEVDIILPQKSNLPVVQWATTAQLWQNVERGCRVFLSPPPFDHSKLMVVDGAWALIGSANWDPRSLRLNFEFNVECYGRSFAEELEQVVLRRREGASLLTLAELDGRPLPVRVRDGVARLFSPYL
jgi:cardiolipin synthase A/B